MHDPDIDKRLSTSKKIHLTDRHSWSFYGQDTRNGNKMTFFVNFEPFSGIFQVLPINFKDIFSATDTTTYFKIKGIGIEIWIKKLFSGDFYRSKLYKGICNRDATKVDRQRLTRSRTSKYLSYVRSNTLSN